MTLMSYLTFSPVTARPMIRRWISDVPSKVEDLGVPVPAPRTHRRYAGRWDDAAAGFAGHASAASRSSATLARGPDRPDRAARYSGIASIGGRSVTETSYTSAP